MEKWERIALLPAPPLSADPAAYLPREPVRLPDCGDAGQLPDPAPCDGRTPASAGPTDPFPVRDDPYRSPSPGDL